MNSPTFPPDHRGLVYVESGRPVWWTGKVCIGLRNGQRAEAPRRLSTVIDNRLVSVDAERLQTLLLRHKPKPVKTGLAAARPMPRAPVPVITPTTPWGRLANFVRRFFK